MKKVTDGSMNSIISDRDKFLDTARSYIGKDGYYVCKTKLGLNAVYDWCAYSVSSIMKDCGFIGKYTSGIHSFASDEARTGDGKYGTFFTKGSKAPQAGDFIMFRYSGLNPIDRYSASHIGIVEKVSGKTITTLEGNVEGSGSNWAATSTFKRKTRYLNDISVYSFFRPNWKSYAKSETKQKNKTVDQLANEVIAGKWGYGEDRKNRLEKAGYSYSKVQSRVNKILSENKNKIKSTEEIANEVIAGKWGNGEERRKKLTNAGYNYNEVQKIVNKIMK